jgi:ABC-type antimicrobial peptide transport system permease subunit
MTGTQYVLIAVPGGVIVTVIGCVIYARHLRRRR